MKKNLLVAILMASFTFFCTSSNAQTFKVGVFDIELMVQAMPGYETVDSLVRQYQQDSLSAEYEYNEMKYRQLDTTFKVDSPLVAQGLKSKAVFDQLVKERRELAITLVYWQQIAQNKSDAKRAALAEPLRRRATEAYAKVLNRKKYTLILRPNTYEEGSVIDNIFLSVARELKMTSLPNELLHLGKDPDVTPKPAAGTGAKPANR